MRVVGWNPKIAEDAIKKEAMARLQEIAEAVAENARARVPVGKDVPQGKGKWSKREAAALKRSIRVVRLFGDDRLNLRVYAGSKAVFYARFVEYGTSKMAAKPFLRPALTEAKRKLK
jgi:HK97 gp10 family phage protein